jgi:hypothetical protein
MVYTDPENVMRRTRGENATYVIEQVRALGLDPHPTSRLMQMQRVLNRGHVPFDDPDFMTALEAERDMQHLGFVFSQVNAHRDSPKFLQLVRDLLSDSVLPQDNRERSPGRDAQFELYLAAICQNAGLLPVEYVEPDVSCVVEGRPFGIAAKRIKSEAQVRHHIKKAAEQIDKAGNPGVIALDLSLAWNQTNAPIISRVQSQMHVMIAQAQGQQFFDRYAPGIRSWVAGKAVLAVLVFNFRLRLRPTDQWGLDGMTTWLSTTEAYEGAERDYRTFYRAFLKGIPNLTDLDTDEEGARPA